MSLPRESPVMMTEAFVPIRCSGPVPLRVHRHVYGLRPPVAYALKCTGVPGATSRGGFTMFTAGGWSTSTSIPVLTASGPGTMASTRSSVAKDSEVVHDIESEISMPAGNNLQRYDTGLF